MCVCGCTVVYLSPAHHRNRALGVSGQLGWAACPSQHVPQNNTVRERNRHHAKTAPGEKEEQSGAEGDVRHVEGEREWRLAGARDRRPSSSPCRRRAAGNKPPPATKRKEEK
ncbi:hypothetical protein EYF80_045684 [Liparis tanakae]|uniref:Uncharacterized protein n=1 Tax=Liparis tanakae TaxID=230148 RepID=A0A4Z2FS84_9TELE|nr:hypothetical protein EYF80_045684 [Liparis tanakae]